jgi:hypothetical protein
MQEKAHENKDQQVEDIINESIVLIPSSGSVRVMQIDDMVVENMCPSLMPLCR